VYSILLPSSPETSCSVRSPDSAVTFVHSGQFRHCPTTKILLVSNATNHFSQRIESLSFDKHRLPYLQPLRFPEFIFHHSALRDHLFFSVYTMSESRQELLAWANNLLQLNITKVEQYVYHSNVKTITDCNTDLAPGMRTSAATNSRRAYGGA
jgi:hypothetical protein